MPDADGKRTRMGRPRKRTAKTPWDGRVAAAVEATLAERGISQSELRDQIEQASGEPASPMQVSRWVRGEVHLVEFEFVVQHLKPSPRLLALARAIDPKNADELAREWVGAALEDAQK